MDPLTYLQAFMTNNAKEEQFAASFLAEISIAQVNAITADLKRQYGRFLSASASGRSFNLHFDKARVPAEIYLDKMGRIAGLFFGTPVSSGSIESLIAEIANLPGQTSVLVVSNGTIIGGHEPNMLLAVASAAKLAVLLALKRQIQNGVLNWSDVVHLDPVWKSLPSGQLQDWPDGSPVTISTLANLMISVSDNTATDALIRIVGREAIEAITPYNMPFLTTREYFILQSDQHSQVRSEWEASDRATRMRILDAIANDPVPEPHLLPKVADHSIDWKLTTHQLQKLLDETADLPSVGINPGLADAKDWSKIAFKGGSDTGVLNMSLRLVGRDGSVHHVISTWNNDVALNDASFMAACGGIIARLAQQTTS